MMTGFLFPEIDLKRRFLKPIKINRNDSLNQQPKYLNLRDLIRPFTIIPPVSQF
ncbi:hypothetical protein NBO_445g0003 [Nosema bombycis CQ1]|uniref:Uncharacterized protein n=1 Tax=Nosema bombycis (strain CQ1 / CVCC 102059) TaxID=578461 RepID=R0MEB5_NOSB1|nr:hypothetical protein NBO_445g0003 [Nosema bombycis CQ1]|eukprot:EOB12420.1 hypothetical protein NBO_445g0003 [Nosema bombycis CQ1]